MRRAGALDSSPGLLVQSLSLSLKLSLVQLSHLSTWALPAPEVSLSPTTNNPGLSRA